MNRLETFFTCWKTLLVIGLVLIVEAVLFLIQGYQTHVLPEMLCGILTFLLGLYVLLHSGKAYYSGKRTQL